MKIPLVILLTCLLLYSAILARAAVLPGIDVLAERNFDILQGRRIGLITNHTGRSAAGASTIDLLYHAPGVRLVALFSPEHGIRGAADEKIGSAVDQATGLPIYSLYGASCRPTPEMLQGLDGLVFDIQDIGTRFYTYIGTLSLAMRAAKEQGIPFIVLDRPNPLGGLVVEGAIPAAQLQEGRGSCGAITCIHPIPTRHGMTVGELARLFNSEYGINCDLTVITMQGWQRAMYYDETGLKWINPSPNMKSLTAAILYPGLGILETSSLSVGRGTEAPFQKYGAPWVNLVDVERRLATLEIPGLTLAACRFVPTAKGHPYVGQNCSGVCVTAIDRAKLDPVLAGLHLVQAFYELYPKQFRVKEGFAIEVGSAQVWDFLTHKKQSPEKIAGGWNQDLERFRKLREQSLLY
ncbi:MAG TPA: DUF1343 domain-containing protein [Desulfuromonadaceae bacterium]|jgi:uncharacterized protein YbbC (DUF1343 family)